MHAILLIGGFILCLAEAALIVVLILERRRRRTTEESLRHKTDEMDQFFTVSLDLLCVANVKGQFIRVNPSFERVLGYTTEELMAKPFLEFVHPDDVEATKGAMATLGSQKALYDFANRYRCRDGTYRWFEWRAVPSGNLICAAARDITERRRAEEAQRVSEQKFKAAFSTGADAYVIVTRDDGMIREVNDRFLELYGYSRDEVIGRTSLELGMWATPEAREQLLEKIRAHDHVENFEVLARRKGGETFWVLYSVSQLKLAGPPLILAAIRDITERKRAEQAIEDRLRFEELLSNVSSGFVNIPSDQVDSAIERGLKKVLEFFQVDRVGLVQVFPHKASFQVTHAAIGDDVPPVRIGVEFPVSLHPWTYNKLIRNGEVVAFSSLDDVPAEANVDRQTWSEWGIRSNLNIPIVTGDVVGHIIAINSTKKERCWPEELIPRLRLLGEIFTNALERNQMRVQVEERLRFETFVSNLSAGFLNLPSDEVDGKINEGLHTITEFFDADRCSIGLFAENDTQLMLAFEYHSAGTEPGPGSLSKEQMPWYLEQLLQGKTVVINRIEDLPPEAKKERQVCVSGGLKSVLSIPLLIRGKTFASCALVLTRSERVWPEELVRRFRLIGEVFGRALERSQADEAFRENQVILRQNEDDLRRLAGRLIHAQEEERRRLARELHDDLAQRLTVFAIDVGRLEQQWLDPAVPVKEELREMKENVVKMSQDVHNLSRQLHPSILDDLGLIKAVEAECMNFSRREGVDVVFNHENISRVIPRDASLSLYRIVQEGLRNISKHACAEHISISLMGPGQDILLSIQDDGIGFDWAEVKNHPGLGFSSMRERARLIHGKLSIQSQPEKGTVITVRVPLTGEER